MDTKQLNKYTLNDAVEAVSTVFQTPPEALYARNGKRLEMHVRGCMFRLLFDNRYSCQQIADITGVTHVTIWHWVRRWKKYLEADQRSQRLYLQVQIRFARSQAKTIRKLATERLSEMRTKEKPAV